jgi:hypothetical protein
LWTVFLALSVLDLGLTWYLLEKPGGSCYEANPLAAKVLAKWGWWGLCGYKLACAGTVLAVAAFVSRRRPWLGRRLLAVGCPVVALVVGYSLLLLVHNREDQQRLACVKARSRQLADMAREQREYFAFLTQVGSEVAQERLSLKQATAALAAEIAGLRSFDPLPGLRNIYHDLDHEARLAAHVVRQVGLIVQHEPRSNKALARLEKEFAERHGCTLPESARGTYWPEPEESARPNPPGGRMRGDCSPGPFLPSPPRGKAAACLPWRMTLSRVKMLL